MAHPRTTGYTKPMAIRHGLAGHYGKSQAAKQHERTLLIMLTLLAAFTSIASFITGYFWSRGGSWFVTPILACVVAIFYS